MGHTAALVNLRCHYHVFWHARAHAPARYHTPQLCEIRCKVWYSLDSNLDSTHGRAA